MTQVTLAGAEVQLDDNGYLADRSQWNREIAAELAKEEGIDDLTEEHWKVIEFIEKDFAEKHAIPGMRRLNKVGGIPTKDLYRLFPGGPIKKASRIAGYPKPASCV
jgi:TusE/DsrC/DsvC family sulfur relay protein